jgi:tetratricopeptide (TPR) repeat protein
MKKSILFMLALMLSFGSIVNAQTDEKQMKEASKLYEKGEYKSVIKLLKPETDKDILNPESEMLLADAYHKQEDFMDAIEHYDMAEKKGENSFNLYFHRARAYISVQEYKKASKDLDKAISFQPDNSELYFFRAYAETELENYNNAMDDYSKAIELNPEFMEAYFNRGAIKIDMEDYEGGISDLGKVQVMDPQNEDASLNLAIISYEQKNFEEALPMFEQIIEITNDKQNKLDANYYIAECYDALGDTDNACKYFYKAMKLGDKDSEEIYENYCENNEIRNLFKPRKKLEKVSF